MWWLLWISDFYELVMRMNWWLLWIGDVYELLTSMNGWRLWIALWRLWIDDLSEVVTSIYELVTSMSENLDENQWTFVQSTWVHSFLMKIVQARKPKNDIWIQKRHSENSKKNYNIFWNSGFCKVCWLSGPEQTTSRETDFKYFSHIKALNSKCIVCSERRCIVVQNSQKSYPWLFFFLWHRTLHDRAFLVKEKSISNFVLYSNISPEISHN